MAHKAGYVNIIGEPNVGKSTLLNALLGEQLVITNPKAQTTRHRILGILNGEDHQLVLSDTPGILDPQYPMHERMMDAVDSALKDADILLVLVELGQRPERSENVLQRAQRFNGPLLLLVNKMDRGDEAAVLESLELWQKALPAAKVVPISALHGFRVDELRQHLIEQLPEHPAYFPKDELSDRNMRFFVSEMIREKILAYYQKEIPYSTEVVVNSFEEKEKITHIQADVIVMRESQKGIVIGRGGIALRKLGTEARKAIERFLGVQVFLDLRVKVDPDWRQDAAKLKRYGY
ncbi:MAG: GTPase Era [Flavobacteriales bacterium]|jgi:GTP-binding protein Era|nr:GTPase Era [Flavobacteriales bacterium]MBK6754013.1 GTPase Era [Flavobacteriales bacterium]MBK7271035.1 GTPase Era [Flavobacteriales bacterium]MBK7751828.1 GTPase Era [Flavobacteriales bacterium]MBK9076554.1 GTPase Era [Flavobacteriales bacterium]